MKSREQGNGWRWTGRSLRRWVWDISPESWMKKRRGTSGDLRKEHSRHKQVWMSRKRNNCICLLVLFLSPETGVCSWRRGAEAAKMGEVARDPTAKGSWAMVGSLGFILNTRRCHWRVLSFAEGYLGRWRIRKHHIEVVWLYPGGRLLPGWYNLLVRG